ncbi:MAG TPA: cellulose binding domain-containing protein [Pilimelia sp.]|nr:cellulose binding domain-containing protein [Pilimelia sp.]
MRSRTVGAVLLAVVTAALALVAVRPAESAAAAPVRIMPLGDSITGSPGCWRSVLWNRLISSGYTEVDFVGTLGPQGCGQAYDGENEGHGGFLATNVANQNLLPGWLAATRPDVVLMHFGTNDVWNNRSPAVILDAFSTLVNQMRASNPAMRILVAKIIPMTASNCGDCGQRVVALNNAIPGWAAARSTTLSPIIVVDQWTGFNTATDTYDGVHPNANGDRKMSDRWYPALTGVLSGGAPGPSPTPSRSPSPSPSPSLSPSASPSPSRTPGPIVTFGGPCAASYAIVGQWQGGFQGEVTVRNTSAVTIAGWTARFSFGNGQVVTDVWNGVVTQSGPQVTVGNISWNGRLAPGATATVGFLARWSGSNDRPLATCAVS